MGRDLGGGPRSGQTGGWRRLPKRLGAATVGYRGGGGGAGGGGGGARVTPSAWALVKRNRCIGKKWMTKAPTHSSPPSSAPRCVRRWRRTKTSRHQHKRRDRMGGANPAARKLGHCHGTWGVVSFCDRTFEWRAVIATFLSVLSIVPRHCARLTSFLHPKLRTINAVLMTPQLMTLPSALPWNTALITPHGPDARSRVGVPPQTSGCPRRQTKEASDSEKAALMTRERPSFCAPRRQVIWDSARHRAPPASHVPPVHPLGLPGQREGRLGLKAPSHSEALPVRVVLRWCPSTQTKCP